MGKTNKVAFNDENYNELINNIPNLHENYGKSIESIVKTLEGLSGNNGDLGVDKVSKNIQSICFQLSCIKNDVLAYFVTQDKIISEYIKSIERIDQLK